MQIRADAAEAEAAAAAASAAEVELQELRETLGEVQGQLSDTRLKVGPNPSVVPIRKYIYTYMYILKKMSISIYMSQLI